jgi:hypothetical protein
MEDVMLSSPFAGLSRSHPVQTRSAQVLTFAVLYLRTASGANTARMMVTQMSVESTGF